MKASHRIAWRTYWLGICLTCLIPWPVVGEEVENSSPAESQEQIKALIAEWDNPSFSARRVTSQKLESSGVDAYEPLGEAAIQRSPEITHRVLEILKRGLLQSDVTTRDAARKEIQRIAASGNASASRAATELLHELQPPTTATRNRTPQARIRVIGPQGIPGMGRPIPGFQGMPGMGMPGLRGAPGVPGMMPGGGNAPRRVRPR